MKTSQFSFGHRLSFRTRTSYCLFFFFCFCVERFCDFEGDEYFICLTEFNHLSNTGLPQNRLSGTTPVADLKVTDKVVLRGSQTGTVGTPPLLELSLQSHILTKENFWTTVS